MVVVVPEHLVIARVRSHDIRITFHHVQIACISSLLRLPGQHIDHLPGIDLDPRRLPALQEVLEFLEGLDR